MCYEATKKEYDNNYYSNYYGQYYSNYYTFYYGTVYSDHFSNAAIQRGVDAPNKPKNYDEGGKRVDGIAYPSGTAL
jgi:hypothetical protein